MKKLRFGLTVLAAALAACNQLGEIEIGGSDGGDTHTHAWGGWTVTAAPTCTADGIETRVCLADSSHAEIRGVNYLGHDWGDWAVVTPAACETTGVERRACARDPEHAGDRVIPMLYHSYDEAVVTKGHTATEDGELTSTCANDPSHTLTETIPATGVDPLTGDLEFVRENDDLRVNVYKNRTTITEGMGPGADSFTVTIDGVRKAVRHVGIFGNHAAIYLEGPADEYVGFTDYTVKVVYVPNHRWKLETPSGARRWFNSFSIEKTVPLQ